MRFPKLIGRLRPARNELYLLSRVQRALALHRRGGMKSDRLILRAASTTLRVEWVARELHPWDRWADPQEADRLFARQCLADTDAALTRLFDQMPDIDTIEVSVLRRPAQPPLMTGVVHRRDLKSSQHKSPAMKLKALGVTFQITDWRFVPLATAGHQDDAHP